MKKYLTISNGRDGSLVGHKIWLASEDPFVDALPETTASQNTQCSKQSPQPLR